MTATITHLDRRPRTARDCLERALAAFREARRRDTAEAVALREIAEAYLRQAESLPPDAGNLAAKGRPARRANNAARKD